LIKFMINSSIGNAMGCAPFKINYRYMPTMMREMRTMERTPPGVRTFALNTLKNMTLVHDVLIKIGYSNKNAPIKDDVRNQR